MRASGTRLQTGTSHVCSEASAPTTPGNPTNIIQHLQTGQGCIPCMPMAHPLLRSNDWTKRSWHLAVRDAASPGTRKSMEIIPMVKGSEASNHVGKPTETSGWPHWINNLYHPISHNDMWPSTHRSAHWLCACRFLRATFPQNSMVTQKGIHCNHLGSASCHDLPVTCSTCWGSS